MRGWNDRQKDIGLLWDAACQKGDAVAARLLLEAGAPMFVPTWAKNAETLAVLLDHGSQVDPTNSVGDTALHWYAGIHQVDMPLACAVLLLEAGADVNLRNKAGQTPLGIARELEAGHEIIDPLVRNRGVA